MSEQWVIGLSIDEDIRWGAAKIDDGGRYVNAEDRSFEYICDLPDFDDGVFDMEALFEAWLRHIRDDHAEIFKNCVAVGISTIGVVDIGKCTLLNVRQRWRRRKRLLPNGDRLSFLADFKHASKNLLDSNISIGLQNNTTAKCLAEYYQQDFDWTKKGSMKRRPAGLLFYATFQGGVNGCFVRGLRAQGKLLSTTLVNGTTPYQSVSTLLNQELGHVCPPPRFEHDNFLPKFSGCPIHDNCFIAISSGTRIFKQYKKSLFDVRRHKDNPCRTIAFYVAHFCWNAVVAIQPDRILISDHVVFPEMLDLIEENFDRLNACEQGRYFDYPALKSADFIAMAALPADRAGVYGALETARRVVVRRDNVMPFPEKRRG